MWLSVVLCSFLLTLTFVRAEERQVTTTTASPVRNHHDDDLNGLVQALNALPQKFDNVGYGPIVSLVSGFLLDRLATTQTEVGLLKARLQTLEENKARGQDVATSSDCCTAAGDESVSSSFVRWGRNSCPGNTSTLVYMGMVGGKHFTHKGSGSNSLCLTSTPQFDDTPKPPNYGLLYGTEYEGIGNAQDHDVPCSVCLAPHPTTIMIPGTLTCPPGWTFQYNGHLVSTWYDYFATEFVCLDSEPGYSTSGSRNDNGNLFYFVLAGCGALPCPPYAENKVVTCVVCSK